MNKKEKLNYFDEFAKSAEYAKDAAFRLKEYIFNFDVTRIDEEMKAIHELEHNADENLHKIKNFLLKDFLPPIDREDIMAIAHKIDDIVDGIDETMINLNILNITEINGIIKNSVELLLKTTTRVYELILNLKNLKKIDEIKERIIEINSLEEKADRLYEETIRKLYDGSTTDAILIMKLDKIYESIEKCFDCCENVADSIEEVIMKNS